jgi:hypothetical protein
MPISRLPNSVRSRSSESVARPGWLAALALSGALGACSPALDWREVSFDDQPSRVLLPCKPEQAQREVVLGETRSTLRMLGCEAQGMHFTWSRLDMPAQQDARQVMQVWQRASLAALGANAADAEQAAQPVAIKGADQAVAPVMTRATGKDGMAAQWVWWMQGQQGHQLAVYAPSGRIPKQAVDTLLEGIDIR